MKISTEQVLTVIRNAARPVTIIEIGQALAVRQIHQSANAIRGCITGLLQLEHIRRGQMIEQVGKMWSTFVALDQAPAVVSDWTPYRGWSCSIIPVREGNEPAPDPYAEFAGQRYHRVGVGDA